MREKGTGLWAGIFILPLLAGLLAWGTYYLLPPSPSPAVTATPEEAGQPGQLTPAGLEQILELYRAKALFIDVRPAEEFAAGHIPGAVRLGPEISTKAEGRPIVLYGRAGDLDPILSAGEKLVGEVDTPVFVFLEGIQGWLDSGQTLKKGGSR